ncbi:hypothetical protein E308F_16420 [Moorella sp. E308F]|uniref:type VII toxin-antitoxin system HepT family RNase toxin n=1 Tax=unclassified Neomoorella TaxID=2676739 RepID=UPI0010FFC376|nr:MULTISPECIES: DUF86 domain-containing protein [unclassified Moorella (in: firmicutes)]GEA15398.1 hypothetical protein E308F_16420 [Moorella sp. E308F]GEA19742.1 hypothetical protein E306M_28810 [Moorella sp. E306M]
MNLERVLRRLKKLEEYVNFLKEYQNVSLDEFLHNHQIYSTVERDMELAIVCIIDIGNYIISAMDLPEPETYADIPLILGAEGIIPQDLARKLAETVRFRNILVYEYMDIDRRLVYKHLQTGLDDLVEFIYGIGKFLGIREL